jgi:hypothetical protein
MMGLVGEDSVDHRVERSNLSTDWDAKDRRITPVDHVQLLDLGNKDWRS